MIKMLALMKASAMIVEVAEMAGTRSPIVSPSRKGSLQRKEVARLAKMMMMMMMMGSIQANMVLVP